MNDTRYNHQGIDECLKKFLFLVDCSFNSPVGNV